jgi:hypothetical protein
MPTVQANGIDMYYEVQGSGEPLVIIPYLAADQACYAFQVPPLYENVEAFNERTAKFLNRHTAGD